jgi:hypothetical protein
MVMMKAVTRLSIYTRSTTDITEQSVLTQSLWLHADEFTVLSYGGHLLYEQIIS